MFSLAVGLASLVLVLVGVLAIPVSLVVEIERVVRLRSRLRVQWLFGLVDVELSGEQSTGAPPTGRSVEAAGRPQPASSRNARSRRGRGPAIARALIRTEGLAARIARLFRDLVQTVTFQGAYLRIDFGLDDPADTGRLYGSIAPFVVTAASHGFDVQCRPNFQQASLQGSCGGQILVTPISVLGVMVGFLCSPPILRAAKAVWEARR